MKRLLKTFLGVDWDLWLLVCMCLLGVVIFLTEFRNVHALELETGWRKGDILPIYIFCPLKSNAENYAGAVEDRDRGEVMRTYINGVCVIGKPQEPLGLGRLVKWESGPYRWGEMNTSVWRIESPTGLVAYTVLPDAAGPHEPKLAI